MATNLLDTPLTACIPQSLVVYVTYGLTLELEWIALMAGFKVIFTHIELHFNTKGTKYSYLLIMNMSIKN